APSCPAATPAPSSPNPRRPPPGPYPSPPGAPSRRPTARTSRSRPTRCASTATAPGPCAWPKWSGASWRTPAWRSSPSWKIDARRGRRSGSAHRGRGAGGVVAGPAPAGPQCRRGCVVGGRTILVIARRGTDLAGLAREVTDIAAVAAEEPARPRLVRLPVVYDGPDLEDVASLTGLATGEVIRRHSGASYRVAFVGFSPGFGYLAGGDPSLRVARLAAPRIRVPAGSVAVAAGLTAVYP